MWWALWYFWSYMHLHFRVFFFFLTAVFNYENIFKPMSVRVNLPVCSALKFNRTSKIAAFDPFLPLFSLSAVAIPGVSIAISLEVRCCCNKHCFVSSLAPPFQTNKHRYLCRYPQTETQSQSLSVSTWDFRSNHWPVLRHETKSCNILTWKTSLGKSDRWHKD